MLESKENLKVKIVDFGIAGLSAVNSTDFTNMGTIMYLSPEILLKKPTPSPSMDIWTMGCILYW